jgi:predicted nucleic acid-binding protein
VGRGLTDSLLDTSVVIAADEAGSIDLPERAAISVITLGELRAGVLRAPEDTTRALRERRLESLRAAFDALPVDAHVAHHFGEALAWARSQGRASKATDLLIVATAAAADLSLVTLDRAQASVAEGVGVAVWESP